MAGTATVIWWHIPSVFAFSMHSHLGDEIEKTTFFLGGLFFWRPVLRQWADRKRSPDWSIVFYLFLATFPCDVLSAFLTFCGRIAYAFYASGPESMQSAALRDQERAGALMWTWVTFAYLTPAVLIAISKLSGSSAPGSRGRHQPLRGPRTEDLKMATEPILAALDVSPVQGRRIASSNVLFDYWELTKPEINFLIAITAAAGFWIGSPAAPPHFPWMRLIHTLLGTVFVASGAATLNQLIELQYDAQMRRTARRPLASGRIAPSHALWFGVLSSVFGVVYLAISTNAFASLLATVTLLSYLFLYTPLKRITPLCTLVGAVPGAAPPLIG